MITAATTNVYVRVDVAAMSVLGVSDEPLVPRDGFPVFNVAANFNRLDYYVVEKNAAATYGVTVRPATADERAATDAKVATNATAIMKRSKDQKAISLKDFYDNLFIRRFIYRGFMSVNEGLIAASYSGTNEHILTEIKPLAIKIENAYIEWRHLVIQPVIDAMYADESGASYDLDDKYRATVEDQLDTFLPERGFDLATYHR